MAIEMALDIGLGNKAAVPEKAAEAAPEVRGVWGSRQKWRAVTWKGFSNRAGLSSTVTFVTVTHAILEPHPSTAKTQVRLEVCGTKEQMLSGRRSSHAHAGMGGARKGARWSRIYAHACAGPRTC